MALAATESVTVAAGETESSVIDLRSRVLRSVIFPEGWEAEDPATFQVGVKDPVTNEVTYVDVDGLTVNQAPEQINAPTTDVDRAVRLLGLTRLIVTAQEAGEGAPATLVINFSSFDFTTDSLDFVLIVDGGTPIPVHVDTDIIDGDGFTQNVLLPAFIDADTDPGLSWVVDGGEVTITTDSHGFETSIEIADLTDEGPNTDLEEGIVYGIEDPADSVILFLTEART